MSPTTNTSTISNTIARLVQFRCQLYGCLTGWPDALFELHDALLCSPAPVGSIPSLSLEPVFSRSHGSLYKALSKGRIDAERLAGLLVGQLEADLALTFAVDASTWDRCDAECSPERGFYYSASKHSAGKPIVAGWSYQFVVGLLSSPDSWVVPVDLERITPCMDATTATIAQVRRVLVALPSEREVPLFVFDAGYDPIAIGHGLRDERVEALFRIRSDRVFYADPPKRRAGQRGRPARHGKACRLADPRSLPRPAERLDLFDPRYGKTTVQAWHDLHPRLHGRGRWKNEDEPPIVRGSVIKVEVEHLPKGHGGVKKTLWLWWSGTGRPDLERCARAYLRRFDIEHFFRFIKSTLGWTTPSLRLPEQADRWSLLVAAAYSELRLARGLVEDLRLPWEKRLGPSALTPARLRRGFRLLRAKIGTPANPPKYTIAGPGRPKGTRRPPRTRYPAVKRAA
jgi:hypothetical protein